MPRMAKKKKSDEQPTPAPGGRKKKTTADQHLSGFMVRLPEKFRMYLLSLQKQTRRTITMEVQLALEEYLKKHGIWPPEEEGGVNP